MNRGDFCLSLVPAPRYIEIRLFPSGGSGRGAVGMSHEVFSAARRHFINVWLGSTFGLFVGSILYGVLRFLTPPPQSEPVIAEVDAGLTNDREFLEKGFKIVKFGLVPVIVIRASETDYRAYGATCTHLGCVVEYLKSSCMIACNCHNGRYDLDGRNAGGPPPRPLSAYRVNVVARRVGGPQSIVITKT